MLGVVISCLSLLHLLSLSQDLTLEINVTGGGCMWELNGVGCSD